MRLPLDPFLWHSDTGTSTAFSRSECPSADDALWAEATQAAQEPWWGVFLDEARVRLG